MNYAPERTAIGPFTTGLSEYLVSRGHRVYVVTAFPHYPEWEIQEPYKGRIFLREMRNGVSLRRCYVRLPRNSGALQRILYDCSFSVSAFLAGLGVSDIDVVVAVTPPVQLGFTAWILSRLKRASFIFKVHDLAVDAAVALNLIENRAVAGFARWLESLIYKKARNVLVICRGFAESIMARGVPESKILVLPDWVDTDVIRPLPRQNQFRQTFGIEADRFLVLYAGNMGAKQGLENAIRAAERLQQVCGVLFLFVGEGSEKSCLVEIANEGRMENVRFMPLQPNEMLPYMLSAADVLLINQRASVVDIVIPCKLLTYMAAGRPVVAAVHADSEAAKYIRRADCGLVVPPEQPQALADAVRTLHADRSLAERLGRNGRSFAEVNFAKQRVLQRYDEFFAALQGANRQSAGG
jgi:colanic acid biosynthesis glycosyl transferase WcaI